VVEEERRTFFLIEEIAKKHRLVFVHLSFEKQQELAWTPTCVGKTLKTLDLKHPKLSKPNSPNH